MLYNYVLVKPKFTHAALLVKDVDKTADFYIKYCKLKVLHRRADPNTGYRVIWLGENLNFVIVALEGEKKPIQSSSKPLSHFGFSLKSREEVNETAEVARQERLLNYGPVYLDPVAGYLCEILDPDGNSVEFSFGQELASS